MDAQTLYHKGVQAIRERGDLKRGHGLLTRSLRHNPHNDMAWVWLVRTVQNPQIQLDYVERALRINPANHHALHIKEQLQTQALAPPTPPPITPPTPPPIPIPNQPTTSNPVTVASVTPNNTPPPASTAPTVAVPVTKAEKKRIMLLMQRAEDYLKTDNTEAAIAQWVKVLAIRVDYEEALAKASGHLWQLYYREDARELIGRAVLANTKIPTIYMTALDMAERQGDYAEAAALRERIASLPNADDELLVTVADYYCQRFQYEPAMQFIEHALEVNPNRQKLLLRLGDLHTELYRSQTALTYYDRAVRLGTRTTEGKDADQHLLRAVPVITDRERGSMILALREAAGFALFLLVMAWQDAGLNLLALGPQRWVGVLLGFVGSYLLITATSSPQQTPIAAWLGGHLPDHAGKRKHDEFHSKPGQAKPDPTQLPILAEDTRLMLGATGAFVLVLATWLVFYRSIGIVMDNPPPYLPW